AQPAGARGACAQPPASGPSPGQSQGEGGQGCRRRPSSRECCPPAPGDRRCQGGRCPSKGSGSQQCRREGCGGSSNGQTDSPGP
ncbi:unnamed protein product, partial [Gulo gulo]